MFFWAKRISIPAISSDKKEETRLHVNSATLKVEPRTTESTKNVRLDHRSSKLTNSSTKFILVILLRHWFGSELDFSLGFSMRVVVSS